MRTLDYYQLLGVSRHATQETLRRAFHERVLVVHPDHHPDDALAPMHTRELVDAYKVLSDPKRRRRYDITLELSAQATAYPMERPPAIVLNHWTLRTIGLACVFFIMAYVVLTLTREVFGDGDMVFRPELIALQNPVEAKAFPVLVHPEMSDAQAWYASQQYQLSLADHWLAREMAKAYIKGIGVARLDGDSTRTAFYRSMLSDLSSRASERM